MNIKIINVFYDEYGYPFKDQERSVRFPIVGHGFQGANNTTQVKFYFSFLGDSSVTWVAVSKLPNGKIGSKVLQTYNDSELGEPYALLELDSFYTQYKGDLFISLQGYQGGVQVTYDEDTELYEIEGTPTIQATGSIKFTNNYATQFVGSGETSNVNFQRILADLGTKLGIRAQSEHVEELPSVGQNDIFYVVNDDPNDPNLQNIYVWNENTQSYVWVGNNKLDLGDYYTKVEGETFEEEIDNRVTGVENELSSVASGSPKGVYVTLAALQAAYPTGTTGIYVVSANGHWYYWNGSAWTDGGTYQATQIEDGSIDFSKFNFLIAIPYNLINQNTITDNSFVDRNNGSIGSNNDFYATDFINVTPGKTYICSSECYLYALYNNGVYASGGNFGGSSQTITIPSGANQIRISCRKVSIGYTHVFNIGSTLTSNPYTDYPSYKSKDEYLDTFKNIKEQTASLDLSGKTINILGDSISSIDYITPNWWQIIENETGATFNNYAISGTSITKITGYSNDFVTRYINMSNDCDMVIVFGGMNDYLHSAILGQWSNTNDDIETLCGALHTLIQGLVTKYPNKHILFINPYRYPIDRNVSFNPYTKFENWDKTTATTLQNVATAIKSICNYYGVECIDMFNESGFNVLQSNLYYTDGLHPNAYGHKLLKNIILPHIKKYLI